MFGYDTSVARQTSMGTLIMWNISKAVKTNPLLDLQSAIRETQERLMSKASDNGNTSLGPEDQYLMCAILAWQQLGHNGSDSLYQFVESKRKEREQANKRFKEQERSLADKKNKRLSPGSFISYNDPSLSNDYDSTYYDAVGPVVKLPVETKIVMHMDTCNSCAREQPKKKPEKVLMDKIDAACCMESACLERLSNLDKETAELRTRAQRLAKREAQRVELLERAEAAWKDLEMGYQRRLAAAEEKEEDMTKHIQKLIQERNGYKNACTSLAKQLKDKGDNAEKERVLLTAIEKEVCSSACERLRLSEETAQLEAELAELQCKSTQLDRELQFKEEQIRGKLQNMENEVDCARALTYEAERTIHAELSALRDQITTVSSQLLEQDEYNSLIKEELEQLRGEKMEMVEDLEGCQALCNRGTQNKTDELNKKQEQLRELKEKVMECQCKLPVDAAVEVKRTPSSVALCKCTPEEKFSESCSCSSLRTTLLTNLLSDLFGGLQSELGGCCAQMPCQLLKCLEDKHNWDKASVIRTNLQKYFSKLLVGELDIAIATSIEKYHARWVGASCADAVRQISNRCGADSDSSPDRVIEKRAQKLAAKLAEQLFQERADQLTAKAKEVLKTGPPPCECSGRSGEKTLAAYPCFVKQPAIGSAPPNVSGVVTPAHWRRTHQNVSQLRAQLEDLKKVSIKKEDLKMMEENIVKMVQRSIPETTADENVTMKLLEKQNIKSIKKENTSIVRTTNTDQLNKRPQITKLSSIKKKQLDTIYPKQAKKNILLGLQSDKPDNPIKKVGQSYAVNLCLCGIQRETTNKTVGQGKKDLDDLKSREYKKHFKELVINDVFPQTANVKQTKPTVEYMHSEDINNRKKSSEERTYCRSDVACFHKPPSNTSIDNLLGTLARWKCDLFKLNRRTDKNNLFEDDNVKLSYENINHNFNEKPIKNNSTVISKKVSAETSISSPDPNFSKGIVIKISKGTDLQTDLPVNTNSEYMGAINLEKSNENFCKCVIDKENILKSPYNCLKSASCNCNFGCRTERVTDIKLQSEEILKNSKVTPELQQLDLPSEKNLTLDALNYNIEKEQMDLANSKKNIYGNDISQIAKASPLFPNDSEYCITFLGVALTNNNSRKDFTINNNTCYNINQTKYKKIDRKCMETTDEVFVPNCKDDIKTINHSNRGDVKFSCTLDSPRTQIGSCDCSVKIDEFKSLIHDVLSKQLENFHKNEDKALDTNSLNNSKSNSCVCCTTNEKDESRDLELNAFHLLEEHLRDKLDEFKITTCKSACISSSDEEKLFSTILNRIRQVISDSTLNITCKCVNEGPSEGSWNRAYILLQEYLKIKIKRVQCLCQSPKNSKQKILPEVLEKVCNLIENDFQRLKTLCKCKSVINESGQNSEYEAQAEVPVKDSNNYNVDVSKLNSDKGTSKQSMMQMQSTESQVSSNVRLNTFTSNNINYKNQTGTNTSLHSGCSNKKCSCSKQALKSYAEFDNNMVINQCNIDAKQNVYTPIEFNNSTNIQTAKKLDINENSDHNELFSKTETPYIGYTVDCSCNGILGTCSCSKSLVSRNTDNIKNIWNTVTSNKINLKNHSYIMNSVSIKTRGTNELKEKNETDLEKAADKVLCDATISVFDNEVITLKISKEKLCKPIIPSTTTTTVISEDNASLEAEEPIDWCDCSSTKSKSQKITDVSDNTWSGSLYYPINKTNNRKRNKTKEKSDPIKLSSSLFSNCECNMVPMCHVKMLVENIEKKLIHSKCTCDSLCPNVCPQHSNRNNIK